jgi:hypothetical protein
LSASGEKVMALPTTSDNELEEKYEEKVKELLDYATKAADELWEILRPQYENDKFKEEIHAALTADIIRRAQIKLVQAKWNGTYNVD